MKCKTVDCNRRARRDFALCEAHLVALYKRLGWV